VVGCEGGLEGLGYDEGEGPNMLSKVWVVLKDMGDPD